MRSDASTVRQHIVANIAQLRRFAFSLTGNPHDADDLLQATVERVLNKGAPDGDDMGKWMYRVCKNIWIDGVRSRQVRVRAVETGKLQGAQFEDGERRTLDRLSLAEVTDAMQRLPDKHRVVLSLIALEGCSYREAAEILEIPAGTVMSRLARARQALADGLAAPQNGK